MVMQFLFIIMISTKVTIMPNGPSVFLEQVMANADRKKRDELWSVYQQPYYQSKFNQLPPSSAVIVLSPGKYCTVLRQKLGKYIESPYRYRHK